MPNLLNKYKELYRKADKILSNKTCMTKKNKTMFMDKCYESTKPNYLLYDKNEIEIDKYINKIEQIKKYRNDLIKKREDKLKFSQMIYENQQRRKLEYEYTKSAIILQSFFRGYLARKNFRSQILELVGKVKAKKALEVKEAVEKCKKILSEVKITRHQRLYKNGLDDQ